VDGLSAISNFAVTGRCNGRCTMCNIWKIEPPEDPPIEKISQFFHKNRNFLKNLQFIQLTGGEPFLRTDLPEIADIVNDVAPKCMIWIPTNGLLPRKIYDIMSRMLKLVDAYRIGVTVSLDGEGEMHDVQRGIDGSYKKAIKTLANLGGAERKVSIQIVNGVHLNGTEL
jgi:MoaA/NifB/PqqE/SkfB family radical SAM enzyme